MATISHRLPGTGGPDLIRPPGSGGEVSAPQEQARHPAGVGVAKSGQGLLKGYTTQVSDGTQTKALKGSALSWLPSVVGTTALFALSLPLTVFAGIGRLFLNKTAELAKSDAKFENSNTWVRELREPLSNGLVSDPNVVTALTAHAKAQGSPLTEQQIKDFVNTGERLAAALPESSGGKATVTLSDGSQAVVESSLYTTQALSWYMMAAAAKQDAGRRVATENDDKQVSDMPKSGAFMMKDPGRKIYSFLNSAPTAYARQSTHVNERSAHTTSHKLCGLFPIAKHAQRGIEDYSNRLPGHGGCILFEKTHGKIGDGGQPQEELYVKFEHGGTPPLFSYESHQGKAEKLIHFFSALGRNVGHCISFLNSRGTKASSAPQMERQEHAHKGTLKSTVADPFKALIKDAIDRGVISDKAKSLEKGVQNFGLPFIGYALEHIEREAQVQGNANTLDDVKTLRAAIQDVTQKLGARSDRFGIERRGAEVHISMDPNDYRAA